MTASRQLLDHRELDVVYQSAFAKIAARDPERALAVSECLRRKVAQLAQFGVCDHNTLRDLAIDLMPPLVRKPRRRRSTRRA